MVTLTRSPMRAIGLDITVKSSKGACRLLAPSWDMVLGYKLGKLSQDGYTKKYYRILNNLPTGTIKALALKDRNFKCYCANNTFCHTYILIHYLTTNYPQLFTTTPEIRQTIINLNLLPLEEI